MRLLARGAFITYATALLALSLWPRVTAEGPIERTDLVIHFAAYLIWTLFFAASDWFGGSSAAKRIAVVGLVAGVWSVISELLQGIPGLGRTVAFEDALANLGGVVLGLGVLALLIPADRRASASHSLPAEEGEGDVGGTVRTISLLTLTSRVLGLARDLLLVRVFGNTASGSAFAAAFAIPNLFRRLFGEGALSAAFIPEYARALREEPETADRYASLVVLTVAAVTGALLAVGEAALVGVLLLTDDDPVRDNSLRLVMLLLPFMPLVCTTATLGGLLQVHGRFMPTAAAPVVLNLLLVGVGAAALSSDDAPDLAAGHLGLAALVAGFAQTVWALGALRTHVRWSVEFEGVGQRVRTTLARFIPALLGLGTIQLNTFIDTLIAMWPNWVGPTVMGRAYPLGIDANAVLFFTQRLYQFPLGVFGIAVATAVFPVLSRQSDEPDSFAQTLRNGIRLSLYIALPASVGLVIVREDLVGVLFGAGDSQRGFDASGAAQASAVLLGYAWAVWAYSLNHVLTRALFALGDTAGPARAALVMVGVNLALNLTLIWFLGVAGLAWSTSIAATGQTVLLARRLVQRTGSPLVDRDAARAAMITLVLALTMGAVVLVTVAVMEAGTVRLIAGVLLGIVGYGLASALTKRPELGWLLRRRAG
ncbi:MAG: murein biosynthesis integral membrane protein MurJ [Planctomycetota bacterium]